MAMATTTHSTGQSNVNKEGRKPIPFDCEQALQMVTDGKTYDEIAAEMNVCRATVLNKLGAFDDSAHARARSISAESWLDRGLSSLQEALDKNGSTDAGAARAYDHACARRAALRNPAYRESKTTELTGAGGGPVQVIQKIVIESVASGTDSP